MGAAARAPRYPEPEANNPALFPPQFPRISILSSWLINCLYFSMQRGKRSRVVKASRFRRPVSLGGYRRGYPPTSFCCLVLSFLCLLFSFLSFFFPPLGFLFCCLCAFLGLLYAFLGPL